MRSVFLLRHCNSGFALLMLVTQAPCAALCWQVRLVHLINSVPMPQIQEQIVEVVEAPCDPGADCSAGGGTFERRAAVQ